MESVPPARLSFTWISEGTGHLETVVHLAFHETADGTEVRLAHEGFAEQSMADAHAEGWDILLELFNEALMAAVSAGVKVGAAKMRVHLKALAKRIRTPSG